MPPFLSQAVIRAPSNETPKQLALLGDTLGRALEQRRDLKTKQEIGQAFQEGGLPAAQQAAFRSGRPDLGVNFTNMIEQQKARAAQQSLAKQRMAIAQAQLGLAQNADARAQVGADRATAMHKAKMNFIGGLGGSQPPPAAPPPVPSGPYQPFDVNQDMPQPQATPAQTMMNAPVMPVPQPQQQPASPYGYQQELAAGVLGMPGVAKSISGARKEAREASKLENRLSPGQKALDKKFAEEYTEWTAGGGYADTVKQIAQLREAYSRLAAGKENLSGAEFGVMPDLAVSVLNPEAMDVREQVQEVAQRSLRQVLGAQFAEREGEKLISRAFNPALDEKINARRVGRLLKQIEIAAEQKRRASEYFEVNGTLAGYQGELPSKSDFTKLMDEFKKPPKEEEAGGGTINNVRYRILN